MKRNIIAISGGGFSEEDNAFIDQYILKVCRKEKPLNVIFIPTASNDAQGYIDRFYEAFKNENPMHLTCEDLEKNNIQQIIDHSDVIYVGGGDTHHLLHIWRKTGFDHILKGAYKKGILLTGISAGAMCWFDICYSETSDGGYQEVQGLGLLKGTFCPHYNDPERRRSFDQWADLKPDCTFYRAEDPVSLHFEDGKLLFRIISDILESPYK